MIKCWLCIRVSHCLFSNSSCAWLHLFMKPVQCNFFCCLSKHTFRIEMLWRHFIWNCLPLFFFFSAELNMEMRHVIVVHTVVFFLTTIRLWLRRTISLRLRDGSSSFSLLLSVSLSCERKVQSVSAITAWLTTNQQYWRAGGVLPPFYRSLFSKTSCGICKREKKEETLMSQPRSFCDICL